MVQCKKCKLFLSLAKDEVVKCKGTCEAVFHKKCVQNIKQFQRSEMCELCTRGEKSPKILVPQIAIDVKKATVESLLAEVNNKLEIIYQTQRKIEDLAENVDFYAEQYQQMMDFKENAEKKIVALENKNTHLQKVNNALEERIVLLEQKETEKSVEIFGLDENKNEDTVKMVKTIAQKLKLDPNNIEETRRVGRYKENENRPRTIIVTLRSKTAKREWMQHKKTCLTNDDVLSNSNGKRLYINENLTKNMRQVFWNTKQMLKDKYKYIWVQDHKVLIKKDDHSKIRAIRTNDDLNRICFSSDD